MKRCAAAVSLAVLLATAPTRAADHPVSSADDIAKIAPTAKPGDVLVMKDGDWTDQKITFAAKGTTDAPITLRAATPGKVILTGASSVSITGEHSVVSGVWLKDNTAEGGDGVAIRGRHNRLTESAVTGGKFKFQVHMIGLNCRMDHCYLAEKTNADPTFQIEVAKDTPNYNVVDHNHFGHRPPLGANGGETIRVGYSGQSQWNSRTTVEHNLFDRCDGEIEIISSKSCENVYRYNTFSDCAGFLTLRHGHRNVVDSNFFLGNHKEGSGGVRVINEGHTVTNNYVEAVDKGAFWITSGVKDGPLTGYTRVKDATIAFNTVVDYAGPAFELASGLGGSNRTLVPEDVVIANNLVSPGKGGSLVKGTEGKYTFTGNVVLGADATDDRFKSSESRLARDASTGLMTAEPPVPATVAAKEIKTLTPDLPAVPTNPHAGFSPRGKLRPLTAKDAGPAWLPADQRAKK